MIAPFGIIIVHHSKIHQQFDNNHSDTRRFRCQHISVKIEK